MNENKKEMVLNYFSMISKRYDLMNTILSFGLHKRWKREAVRLCGLKRGDMVLDLCGGTGDISALALKYLNSQGKVILYDLNRDMINQGIIKLNKINQNKRIEFVQGDAEYISFLDNTFDSVFVGFGIRNIEAPEQALKEVYRVLKNNGRFIFIEFSTPEYRPFAKLYDFYSFYIMPYLGKIIAGSKEAYTYLPVSIRGFYKPNEIIMLLKEAGFSDISFVRILNGVAIIYSAIKMK